MAYFTSLGLLKKIDISCFISKIRQFYNKILIIRSFTLRLFFKIDLFIYSFKMGSYHAAQASLALILRNAGFNMV